MRINMVYGTLLLKECLGKCKSIYYNGLSFVLVYAMPFFASADSIRAVVSYWQRMFSQSWSCVPTFWPTMMKSCTWLWSTDPTSFSFSFQPVFAVYIFPWFLFEQSSPEHHFTRNYLFLLSAPPNSAMQYYTYLLPHSLVLKLIKKTMIAALPKFHSQVQSHFCFKDPNKKNPTHTVCWIAQKQLNSFTAALLHIIQHTDILFQFWSHHFHILCSNKCNYDYVILVCICDR